MKFIDESIHKSKNKLSGVYKITNIINNQFYIGSSTHLYRRFSDHLRYLDRGDHSNPKLQNSWNKYGGDNFYFEIIEFCSPDIVLDKEQGYINMLNPQLNISKIVGYPNTPKAGTLEAKARSVKNLEARKNSLWYNSKELRAIMSSKAKERWSDDDYRKSRSEETKRLWLDEDYRTHSSEVHKKIKNEDRVTIKALRVAGYMVKELMSMFGVSRITIQRIVREL